MKVDGIFLHISNYMHPKNTRSRPKESIDHLGNVSTSEFLPSHFSSHVTFIREIAMSRKPTGSPH
jgi:hypothetical protein